MLDRFYFDADLDLSSRPMLEGSEAHHLAKVLRKRPGDVVQLFDGRGTAANARIESVRGRSVQLVVEQVHPTSSNGFGETWIAIASPKGDRFRWAVEKLTELGVDRLIPLLTERSVVHPRDGKLEKLNQTVVAACKQCRRNTLLDISQPMSLEVAFELAGRANLGVVVAHPVPADVTNPSGIANAGQMVCVGPEGGFTDAELDFAERRGARFASLGSTILRTETAAVAFAVLSLHRSAPIG